MAGPFRRVRVVDSHTAGEPTRVVLDGGPDLGRGPLGERLAAFRDHHDHFRSAVVNEPRGSDVLVGGLLCEPVDSEAAAGIIFFNNVGYLGMCGHGTIGLVATLAHLGKIGSGEHRIETPVGVVTATLRTDGSISLENVPSWRHAHRVTVDVEGHGPVTGDVAWGGNWFFLVEEPRVTVSPSEAARLTDLAWRIRRALVRAGVTGEGGHEIDHVELFGPPSRAGAHSRNFVLCPGGAYDRSPCGTGTSAKVACLMADGKLREGEVWRQEAISGEVFEASARIVRGQIIPSIAGRAFVTGEATLLFDPRDPFASGIRP